MVSKRIRAQREAKGWTQERLADALGVVPGTISRWERGEVEPTLENARDLADALGVAVGWLVGGES